MNLCHSFFILMISLTNNSLAADETQVQLRDIKEFDVTYNPIFVALFSLTLVFLVICLIKFIKNKFFNKQAKPREVSLREYLSELKKNRFSYHFSDDVRNFLNVFFERTYSTSVAHLTDNEFIKLLKEDSSISKIVSNNGQVILNFIADKRYRKEKSLNDSESLISCFEEILKDQKESTLEGKKVKEGNRASV